MTHEPTPPRARRRTLLAAIPVAGAALFGAASPANALPPAPPRQTGARRSRPATDLVTTDGNVQIFVKDWGPTAGRPVVFSHGWPLQSDSWEAQMLFLADAGFRVVAHDRRGFGRSTQTFDGNDMDHYADDLSAVIEHLKLREATLVGFSTGGGEVARYIGRHGTSRVAQAALVSAVTPLMLKTPNNPNGTPIEVFDGLRTASLADRSQLYQDLAAGPFFGANRPGNKVTKGMRDAFWLQGMQAGHKAAFDCIKAFSETDLTQDLKKFDVPTLIIHGDDDQVVPIDASGRAAAKIVKNSTLKVYQGAPHGVGYTNQQQLNNDLLAFVKG
ncbi:MAG TPA: alpha/beta hydrolase [Micromonosporaceae bacterium]|nr:alpha/beta hydrolase [Micromonosporaceae bacterium]